MYYFKVETLKETRTVKSDNIKELKKEYNKILNSYNWLSLTPIFKMV